MQDGKSAGMLGGCWELTHENRAGTSTQQYVVEEGDQPRLPPTPVNLIG